MPSEPPSGSIFHELKPGTISIPRNLPCPKCPKCPSLAHHQETNSATKDNLRTSPLCTHALTPRYLLRAAREAIIAAAQRAGVPYQLAVTDGGVTDAAAAAHLAANGIATLEIKIPRRYSHSPVEMLDLRDLAAVLSLVEELSFLNGSGLSAG